jgi:hypothetical protein
MTDSDEQEKSELAPDDDEPESDTDDPDDPVRVNHFYWLEQALRYVIFLELLFPCMVCSAYDWAIRTIAPPAAAALSTDWTMGLVMGGTGTFALILSLTGCFLSQHIDSRRWFVGGAILGMGWIVLTIFFLLLRAY